MNRIIRTLVTAIVIIFVQCFILNNIELGGYINPYLYILVILILPIDFPAWLTQIVSFVIGFIIDIVTGTLGMHLSACVFIGFVRPFLLQRIAPREGYEADTVISIKHLGINWFLKYVVILTLLHHTLLFFVESFNFVNFLHTIMRIILSSIFTIVLIIIAQFLSTDEIRK